MQVRMTQVALFRETSNKSNNKIYTFIKLSNLIIRFHYFQILFILIC